MAELIVHVAAKGSRYSDKSDRVTALLKTHRWSPVGLKILTPAFDPPAQRIQPRLLLHSG